VLKFWELVAWGQCVEACPLSAELIARTYGCDKKGNLFFQEVGQKTWELSLLKGNTE